jgi:branched-chain amino acid transport system ATP-binding protein
MLKVEGIDVYYGNIQALYSIDFHVDKGEIVSIVGSNGAGKSTTLKTIAGLLHPRKGHIEFLGKKINGIDANLVVEAGVSLVPEGRRIFPYFSVQENLEVGTISRSLRTAQDRELVDKDLKEVYDLFPRLKERTTQKGWSLSGGEQQMLAIGRGLMARPKLLMLDEPSLGLAPILIQDVFEAIAKINKEGTTVLLVEQNARKALEISHRAYVLETGNVQVEGNAKDLMYDPKVQSAYLGG